MCGDPKAYTPKELLGMLSNIVEKALQGSEGAEQAGRLLLGLARKLLGDTLVDFLIIEAKRRVCTVLISLGEEAMRRAELSEQQVAVMLVIGQEVLTYDEYRINNIISKLEKLPEKAADPEALLLAVREIAECVLGKVPVGPPVPQP